MRLSRHFSSDYLIDLGSATLSIHEVEFEKLVSHRALLIPNHRSNHGHDHKYFDGKGLGFRKTGGYGGLAKKKRNDNWRKRCFRRSGADLSALV
jgi:hypothetical protein